MCLESGSLLLVYYYRVAYRVAVSADAAGEGFLKIKQGAPIVMHLIEYRADSDLRQCLRWYQSFDIQASACLAVGRYFRLLQLLEHVHDR